jgi:tetratricopeptide (TPR) repeat protein
VGERFVLQARAGAGGAATVYRALDRQTGATCAVKIMTSLDPAGDERFEREARTVAELAHPALVRYIAHGIDPGGARYLVMEWLEGVDLSQRLIRGPLAVADAVALARRAAEALATLHARGIVHRDVKPSNMFLVDGRTDRVKVVDFGLARQAAGDSVTLTGVAIGTPRYMAPEQVRGRRDLDARVDVYGLGGVLYASLTGRPPFIGTDQMAILARVLLEIPESVRELVPEVPAALDALVGDMLAKDRHDRPADAGVVVDRLDAIANLAELDATPPPTMIAVTGGEQRLLSVVLVSDLLEPALAGAPPDDTDATHTSSMGTTAALSELVTRHRARFVRLPDRSWVVTLVGTGPATDQAADAARLALAMRAQLPTGNIALATGRGQIARRLPTGEVIDRAAELLRGTQGAARQAIALDLVTAELLGERFAIARGPDGVELLGELGGDRARTLMGVATACVGRDAELATLAAIWQHCVHERAARVVLVTGDAGVGKSRLRHELLCRLGPDVEVWMGRGDPLRAGAAFALLAPAIRAAAGVLDGEPPELRRAKLRARVGRHLTGLAAERTAEFLGELVGVPFADADRAPLRTARHDARLMNDHMRTAWIEWVAAETEAAPLLIVLEDLHWGDRPTVKFIDAMLGDLAERPIMVLALARPDVKALLPGLWDTRHVTELPLGQLSRRASERLVRNVLGDRASTTVITKLVEQAAGNALFLEELIRAVAEQKGDALPASVLAMVQARLDRLPAEARRVLRAASVFSNVFWTAGVTALVGNDLAVGEWIDFLLAQEVLTRRTDRRFATEDELVFRHALVRDAAYSLLTEEDRRLGHRHAAAWLERAGETDALVLAEHLERGGELERAAGSYLRAAEVALEASDQVAAAARAAQGLGCLDQAAVPTIHPVRGALHLVSAQAHSWADQFEEQEAAGRRALACLEVGSPRWCRAIAEVAHACGHVGRQDALVEIGTQLAELGARAGARERGYVLAAAGTSTFLILFGHFAVADRLIALLRPVIDAFADDDPAIAGAILRVGAMRAQSREDLAECMAADRASIDAFDRAGDLASANRQRGNLAAALLALGAYAEAKAILVDSTARADALRLQSVAAVGRLNLGLTLDLMGDADGLGLIAHAVAELRDLGMPRLESEGRANLAAALLRSGALAAASLEADRSVAIATAFPPSLVYCLAQRAQIALAEGRAADALEDARRARELLEVVGGLDRSEGEPLVRLAWAEALAATGDLAGARAAIATARQRLDHVADRITDPAWRASFRERVAINARTVALDAAWNPPAVRP